MVVDLSVWGHSHVTSSPFRGTIRATVGAIILVAMFLHGVGEAQAQTAVCRNTPPTAERISCEEDADSTEDIDLELKNLDIMISSGLNMRAIYAEHDGQGDIDIDLAILVEEGEVSYNSITTSATGSHGIQAVHRGTGDIEISTQLGSITTSGNNSRGIDALQETIVGRTRGDGDILISSSSDILVQGTNGAGISASIDRGITGDIEIHHYLGSIETTKNGNPGIVAYQEHEGDIYIDFHSRASIITRGNNDAYGIRAELLGISGETTNSIKVRDAAITTHGFPTHAVYGFHRGNGDLNIDLDDATLTTESTALHPSFNDTFSIAVLGTHTGIGDINIDVLNSRLTTRGVNSYGIYAPTATTSSLSPTSLLPVRPSGFTASGNAHIDVRGGSTIRTYGSGAHGIYAWHKSGDGELRVDVREGASIQVDAANAYAVQLGNNTSGNVNRVAEIGEDGYRRHIVTLNGALSGGRGIFLAGGGKVFIGPKGTIDSTFGLAIHTNGNTPGDPVLRPNLLVDMDLDGRRVADVMLNGGVISNTGFTTIVVNDVKLHDGTDGVVFESDNTTPVSVPNGARDVSIDPNGRGINGRANDAWTFTDRAPNYITSRDFTAEDFIDPPAATCPSGHTGMPPNCVPPQRHANVSGGTHRDASELRSSPHANVSGGTHRDASELRSSPHANVSGGTHRDASELRSSPHANVSGGTHRDASELRSSPHANVSGGTSRHAPGLHHSAVYVSIGTSRDAPELYRA